MYRQPLPLLFVCAFLVGGGCATIKRLSPLESSTVQARRLTREAEAAAYAADFGQAESKLLAAIEKDPTDNRSRAVLADVLWEQGKHQAAVQQMATAVDLTGGRDIDSTIQLGQMLLTSGHPQPALSRAEAVLSVDDSIAEAWKLKGFAYEQLGNPKAAMSAFFRSLSLNHEDAETRAEIAKVYRQLGQPQRALAILGAAQPENVQACEHYPMVCYLRGVLLRELNRPSDAVRSLQSARECGCQERDLLIQLAEAQLDNGEVLAAQSTLQEATQISDQDFQFAVTRLQQAIDNRISAKPPETWR